MQQGFSKESNSVGRIPQHGLKAVRELKKSHHDTNETKHRSPRMQQKVDVTYDYFTKEVDPLVSDCITHLLCTQPDNVIDGMMSYFKGRQGLESILVAAGVNKSLGKRSQRLYLATRISPVLTKLINRIARSRPQHVLEFLCNELEQMKLDDSYDTEPVENSSSQRPSTSTVDKTSKEELANIYKEMSVASKLRPETAPLARPKPAGGKMAEGDDISSENTSIISSDRHSSDPAVFSPSIISPTVLSEDTEFKLQFTVIGNLSSGKTSFLNCIQGDPGARVKPTSGFKSVKMSLGEKLSVGFYDQGGAKKVRGLWDQYYHDAHGFVFVVDASATAPEELEETAGLFEQAIAHPHVAGKPILIIANKQDQAHLLSTEKISSTLHITRFHNVKVFECTSLDLSPSHMSEEGEVEAGHVSSTDPRIDAAVEWLIHETKADYVKINDRVLADIERKVEEDNLRRVQKDRNVLKKKIASVFTKDIDPELMPADVIINDNDVFDKDEGVKFLGGEIGVELTDQDDNALLVAALVGYQRLALQMIGAMHTPSSKKRAPMTWEQILDVIVSIRSELGLPHRP